MTLDEFEDSRCWLLHNLPDIEIDVPEDSASVDVVIMVGSTTIYEEKLYSEDGSICWIRDIPSLLEPYISTSAKVTINGRWSIVMFSRYPVKILLNEDLATDYWLEDNFLTASRIKYVYTNDKIVLAAANLTQDKIKLKVTGAYYQDKVYMTKSIQWEINKLSNVEDIRLFNFTYEDLQGHLGLSSPLVGISIALNRRAAKFFFVKGNPTVTFKWKNCFGIYEFLSLEGNSVSKPDHIFTNAVINGSKKNIEATVERVHELTTGPINNETRILIQDLLLSDDIYIYNDENDVAKIIIEEANLPRNSNKSELQNVSFTFRYARRGTEIDSSVIKNRIFSDEFDLSFN